MKRIGILTFHTMTNYGSFMQCYSLAKSISEVTEYSVEVIDYSKASVERYILSTIISKKIIDIPERLKKHLLFRRYIRNYLPLSKLKLRSGKIDEFVQYASVNYDAVIVGSDEVWKISELRGFPNVYWLHDKMLCKKISYAASANRTDFNALTDKQKMYIRESLNSFDYVGVRDMNTLNQLQKIAPDIDIKMNADPTIMYGISSPVGETSHLSSILKRLNNTKKPILGIMLTNKDLSKAIFNKYQDKFHIVSIFTYNQYCHENILDLSPFEWARIFSAFSGCITNFFHGTVFSIKNGIPFVSVDVEKSAVVFESKLKDLLTKADLVDQYLCVHDENYTINCLFQKFDTAIHESETKKEKYEKFLISEKEKFQKFCNSLIEILG